MTAPRALVAGGGIAGLVVALALAKAGVAVEVVDAREPDRAGGLAGDGRTTAILMPGVRLLERLGVWSRVVPTAAPLARLRIVSLDGTGAPEADVTFAARELGLPAFGWNVANAALHAALMAAIGRAGVRLHAGARVTTMSRSGAAASLACADGRTFSAALLVAADGKESVTRGLAGIEARRQPTGQTAIVTRFAHTRPHHATAIELHRAGGPFTLVPLPGHASSLVWVERDADAAALLALDLPGFARAAHGHVAPWLGAVSDVAAPGGFAIETVRAERLTAERVVVAGEAAHALSPLGAQGFNLSLCDAETLAGLIADAVAAGADIGAPALLDRYAELRRLDTRARVLGIETLGRLVDTDVAALRRARSLGLRAIGALPPLRSMLMRGLMTPVPPLGSPQGARTRKT